VCVCVCVCVFVCVTACIWRSADNSGQSSVVSFHLYVDSQDPTQLIRFSGQALLLPSRLTSCQLLGGGGGCSSEEAGSPGTHSTVAEMTLPALPLKCRGCRVDPLRAWLSNRFKTVTVLSCGRGGGGGVGGGGTGDPAARPPMA
jgi:hypothetical protein